MASVDRVEVLIPLELMDSGIGFAEINRDSLNTIGIFSVRYGKDEPNKGRMGFLKFPSRIDLTIYENYRWKGMLHGDIEDGEYEVFVFRKGQTIIPTNKVVQDATVTESLLKLINSGKLPGFIRYDELVEILQKGTALAGSNLGVASAITELVLAQICRDPHDFSKPFRIAAANGADPTSFGRINITEIPREESVFGGIAFEDMNRSLVSGVTKTRKGEEGPPTPTERSIDY